jgi:hypothetical protein
VSKGATAGGVIKPAGLVIQRTARNAPMSAPSANATRLRIAINSLGHTLTFAAY